MAKVLVIICALHKVIHADIIKEDVQFLNELPLDKLLKLKSSLQELVTTEFENVTTTTPIYENFGAQAMAVQAPSPIKRGDYEEETWHKSGHSSKISNIFSMSVTTLAFLAFGGYLLCLIVHAVRSKQMYYNAMATTVAPATFFVSAGIKKKPQPQFATYGRRRRAYREERSLNQIHLPPEQLYSALVQLCEGYAKWNNRYGDKEVFTHWTNA
ncbi:uncharacterized protein LOC126373456 [Pectinophora gossypiella]|uniref:uncharacterized protein LOC126373456 n=1 Tax=Pectinophora gossypiella TaxID=13191 RepID=UPI00214E8B0E|nr:uncharacterized protein LOC126373456 [Pectinophora gossypiella]